MAKQSSCAGCQITERDIEVLIAIDRHPMTTEQLFRLAQTFPQPFTRPQLLRRRLAQLRAAQLVRSFPLATVNRGASPHYWKLTRTGYRVIYGESVALPKRRHFEEVSLGHHHHTRSLGEFLTHLFSTAVRNGITVQHFARENSVRIESTAGSVYPDCAFQLIDADQRRFNFVVELDNGTERVRSKLDIESIQRKLTTYGSHQSQFSAIDPSRYVVLLITTRSEQRLSHMLEVAGTVLGNSRRTVFLGANLEDYLQSDPFREPVLQDHVGRSRELIPQRKKPAKSRIDRRGSPAALT